MANRDATRGLDENGGIRRNRIPAECHLGGKGEHGMKTTRVLATSERASARASFVLGAIKPWDDHEGLLLRAKMRRPGSATGMPSSWVFFSLFLSLICIFGRGFWVAGVLWGKMDSCTRLVAVIIIWPVFRPNRFLLFAYAPRE